MHSGQLSSVNTAISFHTQMTILLTSHNQGRKSRGDRGDMSLQNVERRDGNLSCHPNGADSALVSAGQ